MLIVISRRFLLNDEFSNETYIFLDPEYSQA